MESGDYTRLDSVLKMVWHIFAMSAYPLWSTVCLMRCGWGCSQGSIGLFPSLGGCRSDDRREQSCCFFSFNACIGA